jgi:hypothetical protein
MHQLKIPSVCGTAAFSSGRTRAPQPSSRNQVSRSGQLLVGSQRAPYHRAGALSGLSTSFQLAGRSLSRSGLLAAAHRAGDRSARRGAAAYKEPCGRLIA